MFKQLLLSLTVAGLFINCNSRQDTTRLEMKLSAFGVEADDFPSITADINFLNDSSLCERSFDNPAFRPSTYRLTEAEIKEVLQLLRTTDFNKLKTEYRVSKTDQPTSTTTIYFGHRTVVIKDYSLEGPHPLQELYKIVYKY